MSTLRTTMFTAALIALASHSGKATASTAALTREQIVKLLGISKPTPRMTPEEMKAGYLTLSKGDPNEKTIALTFDDGPHGQKTDQLLDVLKEYHVPATFFVVGKMASKFPANIRREAQEGHLVENHTYDHLCLDALTAQQVKAEYERCSKTIFRLTGHQPRYCRPPGGDFDPAVLQAATDLGLTTTLWTDDPGDFNFLPAEKIRDRVISIARPGGIILLHDGIPGTIAALPEIIEDLRSKGFRFVSIDELDKEASYAAHRSRALPARR